MKRSTCSQPTSRFGHLKAASGGHSITAARCVRAAAQLPIVSPLEPDRTHSA
jgi:hypothetical protein